ncbi:MAG TPA: hypothetical protein VMQ65_06180 [Candidatus Limnocylindria bacterium]|nr:hypothetical protein [Candidatus Limnocylindria bacterium]
MTDERQPEGAPEPPPPSSTEPPPPPSTEPPPPLAPYVAESAPPVAPPEAQPAVTWQAPPPVVAVPGRRTGLAAAAGIILLLLGILGGLLGLFVAVVGGSLSASLGDMVEIPGLSDPSGVVGGMVAFFGVIVVVYSLVYLFAGIGILKSRNWGRIMGLIVGIISGLIWLGGLGQTQQANIPFTIIMLGIHAYVVVVLIMFWRTKTA